MICYPVSLRSPRDKKKDLEDKDTGQKRMEFLLVVSWFYRCCDDVNDLFLERNWFYEDVPTQTTMFITRQDSSGEIDAAEPDEDHTNNNQLQP